MKLICNLLFQILLSTSVIEFTQAFIETHPDFGLNSEELIKKYNYPFEKHIVETDDGYFLEVHRIPNTKFKNKMKNVSPILLYSGFSADSLTWVLLGPKKGLGFILADNGYDVWMGNNRGTTLCKKHVFLDPNKDKKKFWDFSFQELGYYDIPATIDHVLNVTKQERLTYLGYSQGTSSYFAMLSEKPDYNNKIKFAITLAPVISIQNTLSIYLKILIQNQKSYKESMELLDMHELFPRSNKLSNILFEYCSPNSSYQYLCAQVLCNLIGGTLEQLNKTALPFIISNGPAGASVKEGLHFLQLSKGIFHKFDYDKIENLERYGQETPPIYNLSQARVPTAVIHGGHDIIASPKDVQLLFPKLPNIVGIKLIPKFDHVDLTIGIDAPTIVFYDILKFLKLYS